MIGRTLVLAAALLLAAFGARAQVMLDAPATPLPETMEIGTSTSEIAITSDFAGADLTIFGALGNTDQLLLAIGQYDIVVVLEGPRENATVRKKQRVFGIWVNTRSMTFERVPEAYSLSSTRAVDSVTTPLELNDHGIGLDHIPLNPVGFVGDVGNLREFRDAFRRLQESGGLYDRDPSGVRFVSSSLFKATLRLPANVPNGVHTVRAYLFKSGKFVAEKSLPLRVIKTGIEQTITDAAHEQPIAYGFFAVFLAVVTGWTASFIFRKS
ncbi:MULTISPECIES: TIGR02186 family protein [unclassified Rhizobium]|uniref:TIGR02186 family protein n=1 Tax=unclassified Rhizobium TaxID=2613769 RepID=UPI001ADBD9AD|nr:MULTISPECIES: TIGR02186 family protein [unclassified Rhizobium]MBO9097214.1 TIGR02186 family protein [Rhizobium sp. L58/93]MBO9133935.1 TIGR02186 family protein [Rhizobium sp. B209b/85]MBO9167452.1 TIGR02186 family protein [Rhizobium sp. L245/93]MBO9183411.1 TIGR02186 family protein [Rhizobium sp. E27B/91]QXZ83747.1 TIGR02186 family protein [Rhizobium sp. K1/93]